MRKIKIAVWINKNYRPEIGGGYSYYEKLIHQIDNYRFDPHVEICFITESKNIDPRLYKRKIMRLSRNIFNLNLFHCIALLLFAVGKFFHKRILYKYESVKKRIKEDAYGKFLKDTSIDIVYYPLAYISISSNIHFIATNWDIGHCSTYAFPELINDGGYEFRNKFYTQILPKALMIFAESEAGRSELIKHTNIDEKKIKVIPLFAGNCVDVKIDKQKEKCFLIENGLEREKFFFYPAQFWAHKNHSGLLQAFAEFTKSHPDYKLVLTGFDKGNLEYIRSLVPELGIEDNVLFLGFLSTEYINVLYACATSLVMPTYLGPTNMPPIEAMELGCPVICSDLKGHREILGDAALYFDPMNSEELCRAMMTMANDRSFYREAIIEHNKQSVFKIDCAMERLNVCLKEIALIRNCWR
jgi:glycosyltransferase involved in cell wall biosynthesis